MTKHKLDYKKRPRLILHNPKMEDKKSNKSKTNKKEPDKTLTSNKKKQGKDLSSKNISCKRKKPFQIKSSSYINY